MKIKLPTLPPPLIKYELFIWPIAGGLISVLLFIFLVIPQFRKIYSTNNQIDTINDDIANLNKKADKLAEIDTTEYQNNVNKLNLVLPPSVDATSAISQVQTVASQSNVSVTGLGINLPTDISSNSFQVKLDVTGELPAINNFIINLKQAPRIMNVSKIDVTGDKSQLNYAASLILITYYQKEQPPGASGNSVVLLTDAEKATLLTLSQNIAKTPIISEFSTEIPSSLITPTESSRSGSPSTPVVTNGNIQKGKADPFQ